MRLKPHSCDYFSLAYVTNLMVKLGNFFSTDHWLMIKLVLQYYTTLLS